MQKIIKILLILKIKNINSTIERSDNIGCNGHDCPLGIDNVSTYTTTNTTITCYYPFIHDNEINKCITTAIPNCPLESSFYHSDRSCRYISYSPDLDWGLKINEKEVEKLLDPLGLKRWKVDAHWSCNKHDGYKKDDNVYPPICIKTTYEEISYMCERGYSMNEGMCVATFTAKPLCKVRTYFYLYMCVFVHVIFICMCVHMRNFNVYTNTHTHTQRIYMYTHTHTQGMHIF
eukprot:GHVR01009551.1.p1 GENE.GHVR01009551.1~~GHVR01009551.1.p1  ORF type:complete len:232 (-),score=68.67 GHVR01009551.1:37-732(-)